jgi:hypothetical protein
MHRKLKSCFFLSALSLWLCPLWGQTVKPDAFVKIDEQNYCFVRPRMLEMERAPQSILVLQMRLQLAYRNTNPRPLILPVQHDQWPYTSLKTGQVMTKQKSLYKGGFINPKVALMTHLPPDVSPDNPVDPPNDVFSIIPAGGFLNSPVHEEVQLTIYNKSAKRDPDLRGHRVYLRLELEQQPISPDLLAKLSDMWVRIGVPWTGKLRTNTLAIDVPAAPEATSLCVDKKDEGPKPQYIPLQPPK